MYRTGHAFRQRHHMVHVALAHSPQLRQLRLELLAEPQPTGPSSSSSASATSSTPPVSQMLPGAAPVHEARGATARPLHGQGLPQAPTAFRLASGPRGHQGRGKRAVLPGAAPDNPCSSRARGRPRPLAPANRPPQAAAACWPAGGSAGMRIFKHSQRLSAATAASSRQHPFPAQLQPLPQQQQAAAGSRQQPGSRPSAAHPQCWGSRGAW
jgi:hypothetical protein